MALRRLLPLGLCATGLLILLAGSCSTNQGPKSTVSNGVENQRVTAAVTKVFARFSAETLAGRPRRWASFWDENAIQMPANGPITIGASNIQVRVRDLISSKRITQLQITPEDVVTDGAFAVVCGTYTVVLDGAQSSGTFLTVFVEGTRGSWKIYRSCFESDLFGVK